MFTLFLPYLYLKVDNRLLEIRGSYIWVPHIIDLKVSNVVVLLDLSSDPLDNVWHILVFNCDLVFIEEMGNLALLAYLFPCWNHHVANKSTCLFIVSSMHLIVLIMLFQEQLVLHFFYFHHLLFW
jgi:hypothetical protein